MKENQRERNGRIQGSFRDPDGFLFLRDNVLYRQVNQNGKEKYDLFIKSGLYDELTKSTMLIPHDEVSILPETEEAYIIIKPVRIPLITYPYEWSFSQLKDAALLTLRMQYVAFRHGMSLKDASAYNIQFYKGRPIGIDTLSFEPYAVGKPWVAYRQFCQHFLAPLLLMSYTDIRLQSLLRTNIDGIPLDLVSRLLPRRTWTKFSILSHIHLHARYQQRYADAGELVVQKKSEREIQLAPLLENLSSLIQKLKPHGQKTEWATYYKETNYTDTAFVKKKKLVESFVRAIAPQVVWDIGANTGVFSRVAVKAGAEVVSFDIDPIAVDVNYRMVQKEREGHILPLTLDLTNPSPSLGWSHEERLSLIARSANVDCVLALALIHHLAISNNLPFEYIAEFFAHIAPVLIIEFVPKEDSNVKRLLVTREDIFPHYTKEGFEKAFSAFFSLEESSFIEGSTRILYRMKRKDI
ncbi:MAG: SAM-dependent methyltransferase [Candidatus Ryanbacteria bacterium CG10_big_fil_rev_8_21_14_0_10_43_42]|uniref:SAM-dependent methyltransferase n=1 Tax=Candidatus Ryanbacteria bacterium CG10_big_fil_rev_8_21_14_0_10_43_42 TaxID=1974864 RepID=A0A2M8KXH1_9BACT|nr:MAG: SAM-dependent methyltransferase [Candidatus Ryanbacteria bacterium CG10_big_fil_rev_8_21_14_0_10_43_42]